MKRTYDLADFPERLRAKIEVDGQTKCWLWGGKLNKTGYTLGTWPGSRDAFLHRGVYAALVGPIPKGYVIDHLCRVPRCVNPAHLEAVTNRENILRGATGDLKTHCAKGHLWVPENIMWRTCVNPPRRKCRICYEDHLRENAAKRRAETAARRAARAAVQNG